MRPILNPESNWCCMHIVASQVKCKLPLRLPTRLIEAQLIVCTDSCSGSSFPLQLCSLWDTRFRPIVGVDASRQVSRFSITRRSLGVGRALRHSSRDTCSSVGICFVLWIFGGGQLARGWCSLEPVSLVTRLPLLLEFVALFSLLLFYAEQCRCGAILQLAQDGFSSALFRNPVHSRTC